MKSNLILQEKVAHSGYFLKFFINIRVLWFVDLDERLDFEGWEDLVEFLVIVIANLTFDSYPGVILIMIGIFCG